ncbi:N-6 DNA methylase, partial [bacterium]|nr:N-6 DNA methylase [bacterium]
MTEISLHQWFAEQISQISGSRIIGTPLEVLEKITHAERNYSWLSIIPDNIYPLVVKNDEPPFPNLESRNRQRKRLSGQFYTPRTLINQLLARIGPISPLMKILDPACGDGAFLIESSHALKNVDCINPLDHLWGYDLDAEALLISLGRLLFHYFGRGWPHLELRDFLIDPPNLKFDLILGNPPFKVNLPTKLRKKLSEMYETAEGEKDLCTFFLEGSVNALKPNGRLAMLISNTFLVNHQCKKIRNFLFSKNAA